MHTPQRIPLATQTTPQKRYEQTSEKRKKATNLQSPQSHCSQPHASPLPTKFDIKTCFNKTGTNMQNSNTMLVLASKPTSTNSMCSCLFLYIVSQTMQNTEAETHKKNKCVNDVSMLHGHGHSFCFFFPPRAKPGSGRNGRGNKEAAPQTRGFRFGAPPQAAVQAAVGGEPAVEPGGGEDKLHLDCVKPSARKRLRRAHLRKAERQQHRRSSPLPTANPLAPIQARGRRRYVHLAKHATASGTYY